MPYPDKLLAEDEDVVRRLHPRWPTLRWPVAWFLVVVGGTSFGMAVIPAADVSHWPTRWARIINFGTLTIGSAAKGGATVVEQAPAAPDVQQLLDEEDADRRAQECGHVGGYDGHHGTSLLRGPGLPL